MALLDFGSSDGTLGIVSAKSPFVEVLKNHGNLGFTRANNRVFLRHSKFTWYFTFFVQRDE
jgi:GT2 family glycosyltransferase